jgi:hypothetical protein
MEWELEAKDEEIAVLTRAAREDMDIVRTQQGEYGWLLQQKQNTGVETAMLEEEQRRIKRQHAITEWSENMKARLDQESADVAMRRERRALVDHLLEVRESNSTLRAFAMRMQERCGELARQMEETYQQRSALLFQERVNASAAEVGQQSAGETLQAQRQDLLNLERQMQQELQRTESARMRVTEYDRNEAAATTEMAELMALTACTREIKRVLADPSMRNSDDALEEAVQEQMESLQDFGIAAPPVLRISHNEYLIGSELVQCVMRGGNVCVHQFASAPLLASARNSVRMPGIGNSMSTPSGSRLQQPLPSVHRLAEYVPLNAFIRSRALESVPPALAATPTLPSRVGLVQSPMSSILRSQAGLDQLPISPAIRHQGSVPTFTPPIIALPEEGAKALSSLVAPLAIGC